MHLSFDARVGVVVLVTGVAGDAVAGLYDLKHTFDDPTMTARDAFGHSVAVSEDWALVGARGDDTAGMDVGQAHLFDSDSGGLVHTFDDPTPTSEETFGYSVAVLGNRVLIGAPGFVFGTDIGEAHLFDAVSGDFLRTFDDPTPTGRDLFGLSVALDGDRVLIGAPGDNTHGSGIGQAHLFDAVTGALIHTFDDPTITNSDLFGTSVALDGDRVLIGAHGDSTHGPAIGQAHLFDAVTGALIHTFDDPTPTITPGLIDNDHFGSSVALSGDHVLIGAPDDDTKGTRVGQAHLFDAVTGALVRTFDTPSPDSNDFFGDSVGLSGDLALIGAPGDSTQGIFVGQAYIFDVVSGALLETLDDPTPTRVDQFGVSVSLFENRVLIGALFDDTQGNNVGQVHLFVIPEPATLALVTVVIAAMSHRGRVGKKLI